MNVRVEEIKFKDRDEKIYIKKIETKIHSYY